MNGCCLREAFALSKLDAPLTTFFVSRHAGALEWAARQHLHIDLLVPHLDPAQSKPGDTVIGSLPVSLAAQVCAAGAAYWHLSLELPAELRGRELSADDLERLGARMEPFDIRPTPVHGELLGSATMPLRPGDQFLKRIGDEP